MTQKGLAAGLQLLGAVQPLRGGPTPAQLGRRGSRGSLRPSNYRCLSVCLSVT